MVILETPVFTKLVTQYLSDLEYRELQLHLMLMPDMGDLIPGSGGLRKVRWRQNGKGKRGGLRVIYYWRVRSDRILMLYVYPKNVSSDLSSDQLKALQAIVGEEYL